MKYIAITLLLLTLCGCAEPTKTVNETPTQPILQTNIPSSGGLVGSVNPSSTIVKMDDPIKIQTTQSTSQSPFIQQQDIPSSGGTIGSINPNVQVDATKGDDKSTKNFFGMFSGEGTIIALVFIGAIVFASIVGIVVWKIYQVNQTKELLEVVKHLTSLIEKILD